jgi:ABC-type nitrate/sulfonate/bicarbonate transport system substrate-binding protein
MNLHGDWIEMVVGESETKNVSPYFIIRADLFHVASSAEKLRVAVAFIIVGVASSPSWIAVEKGLWKKYGLDVELILLSGGTDGRTS